MAALVVTEGPATGRMFSLGENRLVSIGRDEECTFQILDDQVSRRHLQVKRDDDGGHVAADYRSANGVYINGGVIPCPTALADGDVIRIGASTLVYTTEDFPDAETAIAAVRKKGEWRRSTLVQRLD